MNLHPLWVRSNRLITLTQTTSLCNTRLLQYALGVGGLKSHYYRVYLLQDLEALAL